MNKYEYLFSKKLEIKFRLSSKMATRLELALEQDKMAKEKPKLYPKFE